jgi:DNA-3-methyladenine glycosylase I
LALRGGTGGEMAAQEVSRCTWSQGDPLLVAYHDDEWGVPVEDDRTLFEFLILEGAQAGLSWLTILRKREAYRLAFDGFDVAKIANYDARRIERLLGNAGIVRNRAKLASTVKNAHAFRAIQKEFGSFARYQWQFNAGRPIQNEFAAHGDVPARTELSDVISKDLKKRGFSFVGSTIIYAYLQAVGMVNDHAVSCFRYAPVKRLGRRSFGE